MQPETRIDCTEASQAFLCDEYYSPERIESTLSRERLNGISTVNGSIAVTYSGSKAVNLPTTRRSGTDKLLDELNIAGRLSN